MTPRIVTGIAALLLAGTAAAYGLSHPDNTISGRAYVVDGDTIRLGGERVRLMGIDAPEASQYCGDAPCGLEAAQALRMAIGKDVVTCQDQGRDRYGRMLAICGTPSILDLGRQMVETGHAIAYRRYSGTRYVDSEDHARLLRLGIWATGFTAPEDYRRRGNHDW